MNDWNPWDNMNQFNSYNMFPSPTSPDYYIQQNLYQLNAMQAAEMSRLNSNVSALRRQQNFNNMWLSFSMVNFNALSSTRKLILTLLLVYMLVCYSFLFLNIPYVQEVFPSTNGSPDYGVLEPLFAPVMDPLYDFSTSFISQTTTSQTPPPIEVPPEYVITQPYQTGE